VYQSLDACLQPAGMTDGQWFLRAYIKGVGTDFAQAIGFQIIHVAELDEFSIHLG
jgi:hypothetical protein